MSHSRQVTGFPQPSARVKGDVARVGIVQISATELQPKYCLAILE